MGDGQSEYLTALNKEQLRILRRGWPLAFGYFLIMSAGYTYLDFFHLNDSWYVYVNSIGSWAAGYVLIVGLMYRSGYFKNGKGSGVGTYFVLGLLHTLLILLASLLFVLPGIYVAIRLGPAFAIALQQGPGVFKALSESWEMTSGHLVPLGIAIAGPVVLIGAVLMVTGIQAFAPVISFELESVIFNLTISIAVLWYTVFGIAVLGVDDFRFRNTAGLNKQPA